MEKLYCCERFVNTTLQKFEYVTIAGDRYDTLHSRLMLDHMINVT